jgi:hypothetical protein
MTKEDSKEIVAAGETGFAIIDQPQAQQNLLTAINDLGITESLLQRVKIPTGGMTAFEVEELEGPVVHKHLDVILVAIKGRQKAWWSATVEDGGGGAPPSCSSTDGIHGFGNNTLDAEAAIGQHLCAECPWGKFGSARGGGAGKDCKDFSVLFFFRQGSRMPTVMNVPATSLKALQAYVLRLIDGGKRMEGVVTRIALKKAQSASGISYSQLDISYQRDLTEADAEAMVALGREFMGQVQSYDPMAARTEDQD